MNAPLGAFAALSDEISAAVERAAASVVAVEARRGVGASGFALGDGLVLTADHALDDDEIRIVGADGAERPATLVARDGTTDLALLRVDRLPALTLADALPKPGALALAVARDDDGDVAATMGVVSAVGGPWRTWRGGTLDAFVRPDLALYPRFDGSPLLGVDGRVIGMNTWGLSRRQPLTVPSATIARVVEMLKTRGRVARGYLGLAFQPVRVGERHGLIVLGVETDGPAHRAGAVVGDVIVGVAGEAIDDADDLQAHLGPNTVGTTLALDLLRGGAPARLDVVVGERPDEHDER